MPAERRRLAQGRPTVLIAVAALMFAARVAAEVHEAKQPLRMRDLVGWRSPSERLSENQKPTLYLFSADWCGPCRLMDREVFLDTKAVALIKSSYIPVKVIDRQQEDG